MLKRRSIIFSVLLLASLGCTQSAQIVGAGELKRPGEPQEVCIALEENLSILVKRNPRTWCADVVIPYKSVNCTRGEGKPIPPEDSENKKLPKGAFSGAGNQNCPEAFVYYENSPYCFQYTSGGRTRYIPRG